MSNKMNINNSQPPLLERNVEMGPFRNNNQAAANNAPAVANNKPAPANNNLNNKSYEELVEYYKTLGGDEADLEGMDEDVIREQITELLKIVQGGGRRRRTRRRASRKTRRRSSKKSRSRRRSSRK
jgi:hypothetical protein